MIKVSISPSQQSENPCIISGCTEQQHMFLVGQQLYNILKIDTRFNPFLTTKLPKMSQSNYLTKCVNETEQWQENDGIRISLHSDGGYNGSGCSVFYYSESSKGKNLAKIVYNKMSVLTPWKDMSCYARPELYEIRKPSCLSILVEVSFHDQIQQAQWIHNNTYQIADTIYYSILEFYELEKQKLKYTLNDICWECLHNGVEWRNKFESLGNNVELAIQKIYYHNKNLT